MEEGIGTIALLQAMDKSLQTGQPIKVNDILKEYGLSHSPDVTVSNEATIHHSPHE